MKIFGYYISPNAKLHIWSVQVLRETGAYYHYAADFSVRSPIGWHPRRVKKSEKTVCVTLEILEHRIKEEYETRKKRIREETEFLESTYKRCRSAIVEARKKMEKETR